MHSSSPASRWIAIFAVCTRVVGAHSRICTRALPRPSLVILLRYLCPAVSLYQLERSHILLPTNDRRARTDISRASHLIAQIVFSRACRRIDGLAPEGVTIRRPLCQDSSHAST
ncbi:hypothetical protein OH76DRAFT_3360 [Lentinus brumalis]|uniref:Secreted protein n=1 Tax=Lentinus brumalis TaxID=2498619 RepID=A0A371DWN9_9APHY|nr:hypothetical protein OH76DRAFT_3360 [Polyporus brumalis]